MDRETWLRMQLADLQARYRAEAKPYIDALVEIEMRKPPRPIAIPIEWIEAARHGFKGGIDWGVEVLPVPNHIDHLQEVMREMEGIVSRSIGIAFAMNGGRLRGDPPQWPREIRIDRQPKSTRTIEI